MQNFESPLKRTYEIELDGEEAQQYSRQKETPTTVRQPRAETEKKAPPPVAKKPVRFKSKTPSANSEKQRSRSPPAIYKRSRSPPATTRRVFSLLCDGNKIKTKSADGKLVTNKGLLSIV